MNFFSKKKFKWQRMLSLKQKDCCNNKKNWKKLGLKLQKNKKIKEKKRKEKVRNSLKSKKKLIMKKEMKNKKKHIMKQRK